LLQRVSSKAKVNKVVKFLIVRFSSIGDIVLTTPVIRFLKTQIEDAEVHYLTKRSFSSVIAQNPYIDKVYVLENSLGKVIQELKKEKYDYIIDLHHNLRSFIVKSRLNVLSFSFSKLNIEKWLIVALKINRLPHKHIVDRYVETLRVFDIQDDGKGLDYFIEPADEVSLEELPAIHQEGYIGFVIGAKHNTKKLPVGKMISLIRRINLPVVLLGGKEDMAEAAIVYEQTGDLCFNACGKYNLGQSASLVQQAKLIITHDTGLMHIAAAFKKKIISVWGSTIPEFGMYPYKPHPGSQIIEVIGLKCRPCSKIGFQVCPRSHFDCMNKVNEEKVVDLAQKLF
jgi:ADP-heptose:LPS heptosyltransferase